MMFFLKLRSSLSEPLGLVVIGTADTIPAYLDAADDGHRAKYYNSDGRYCGPSNPGLELRRRGEYEKSFHRPLQMDGGEAERLAFCRRFADARAKHEDDHLYRLTPELVAYIDEQTRPWSDPWSKTTALAIGFPAEDRPTGDRSARSSRGLAGRLEKRRG